MAMQLPIDVVVAGALNTDLVATVEHAPEAGETVTGQSFAVFSGGKGANQAVAARRSGASVALAGAVGDDRFGADRREELARDDVDLSGVLRFEDQTSGVALITVEPSGENRIAYIPGPTLRISERQVLSLLERARAKVYLQPNEIPQDAARAALRCAREQGATTVLNAAPDPESARSLLDEVDVLIVNEGEARALADVGTSVTVEDVIASLADGAASSVVLTAGAGGVYGHHGERSMHIATPMVDVVDTTGAGDTFCGAFAAKLAEGESFGQAMRWAVTAASLATTVTGAQPSIPDAATIEAFMRAQPS